MKKISCIIILFFSITASAQQTNMVATLADSSTIKKIADEILTNSKAYENLRYLCKKIGPRLSGSANALKAIYATKNMLELAGADTVYLQPCMVTKWVRGAKEEGYYTINGKKTTLLLTALGNSQGSSAKGITAQIIEVKSMEALTALGNQVQGKIVFFNIAMNPTYIKTFRAYGESGVARRSGPSIAAKYGAIGVMVRSLASNADNHPHTGTTVYNDSFPKVPAVAISTNNANELSKQLQKNNKIIGYIKTNCNLVGQVPSFNVVGVIKGSIFPEQILTVGGHLDSWDLAEGAQDDGTGVVQSIEIIRVIKALNIKPLRTIQAVCFMNEENGGGGAKGYIQAAKNNNEQHIFALESDAGGFTPRGFGLDMIDAKKNIIKNWAPLFYPYGVYDFNETGSGSDIGPLKEIGTALAGLGTDSQRYFDVHHAETDVFENVSKRELDLGTVNMAALIWLVSKYGL